MTTHSKTRRDSTERKDAMLKEIIRITESKHNCDQKLQLEAIRLMALKALNA
jgi:hypothetical protein